MNEPTVRTPKGSYWAKERHAASKEWSCVRFSDPFLTSDNPGIEAPYFSRSTSALHQR